MLEVDSEEDWERLEEMDLRGGRDRDIGGLVRRVVLAGGFLAAAAVDFSGRVEENLGALTGEGDVRSSVSIPSDEIWGFLESGIALTPVWAGRSLNGEGVAEARAQVSNVVCLLLAPGEDMSEGCPNVRFGFFEGSSLGDGSAGELNRSSVSIALCGGGVVGRSGSSRLPTGSVRARANPRLGLFVTAD